MRALFIVGYILIGLGCTMAANSYAATNVIETHRRGVQSVLAGKGLDAKAYALSMLEKWDNARLPVIVADPSEAHLEQRIVIYFAVLPDGTLVSAYDVPFERILTTAYRAFTAADAHQLAQLATMFGDFRAPVGFVTDIIRPGTVDVAALPRPDAEVHMTQDGGVTVLEFYTYQATRSQLYDCSVRIRDGRAELKARLMPRASKG